MNNNQLNKSTIDSLRREAESILLVPFPKNDQNQDYWTANFSGWILEPFLTKVRETITDLPINEHLVKLIDNWIDDLDLFIEQNLAKVNRERYVLHQRKLEHQKSLKCQKIYIEHLISELRSIRSNVFRFLEEENAKSDINNSYTVLSRDATSLLILYLQEANVILPHNIIADTKLSEAFETLTGYKHDQIRKSISGKARVHKNEITTNLDHYNKLKDILNNIILQIDKDISCFN